MRSLVDSVRALNDKRLERYPTSPFFGFADRELRRIERRIEQTGSFDRAFYQSLQIGLMCARELEQVDPEFCDAVYAMLEDIRIRSIA